MAGYGLKLAVKDLGAGKRLAGLQDRLSRIGQLLQSAGLIVLRSIDRAFMAGGRPQKWKPREQKYAARMARKGKTKILMVSGNLRNSITAQTEGQKIIVGSNLVYARIHQLGGQAGRNLAADIPARPYLVVQGADLKRLKRLAAGFILGKK
ncbi:MAG: phage virion morphogenesis protein [Thermodesulfobacteriota bacterium]